MYSEKRQAARKVLKVKAVLAMEGAEALVGRTLDVGSDGVCLQLPGPLKVGAVGMVQFDIFLDGKVKIINAKSRVQYCILSNGEFKIGFQFVQVELASLAALAKYLH